MHRAARRALSVAVTGAVLALSACGGGPGGSGDRAPGADAAHVPLTEVDPARIAAERRLPEEYVQPEVPFAERDDRPRVSATVSAAGTGQRHRHGGVGLSFEATDLADERLGPANTDLVHLLRQLDRPVLRFGGNSVDRRFFFTSADEPAPDDWPLAPGEEITTVTPGDLDRVAELAEAADAEVVLGANLAADDPQRAADLAEHGREAFGEDLLALMIGNEPNGFHAGEGHRLTVKDVDWDLTDYLEDLTDYADAVRAEVPDMVLTAPGAYAPDWWRGVTEAGIEDMVLAAHQYPLSSCQGDVPRQSPTQANLVADHTRANVDRFLGIATAQGRAAGLPVWLTETSVSACLGGNEITETLGSAVFAADYALRAQSLGVERLAHHTSLDRCAGGPPMSSLCSAGTGGDPGAAFAPRANHFGLALVGQIPDGDFLRTEVSVDDDLELYAIDHGAGPDGRRSLTLAVVSFADPSEDGRTPVTVDLPFPYAEAVMSQLGGPSWDARFPADELFDVDPPGDRRRTEDADGRALTRGAALTPVPADHVSVDGWGLPLTPVEARPSVPGSDPGSEELRLSLNPGTVTVLTVTGE